MSGCSARGVCGLSAARGTPVRGNAFTPGLTLINVLNIPELDTSSAQ